MNSLRKTVKRLLAGICSNVFYFYPASWVRLPCVAWRESGNRELARADGREILTECTYTVDIWSDSPQTNADLADEIMTRMSVSRLTRTYSADVFETSTRLHHRVLRFRAVVDEDGNVYQ